MITLEEGVALIRVGKHFLPVIPIACGKANIPTPAVIPARKVMVKGTDSPSASWGSWRKVWSSSG